MSAATRNTNTDQGGGQGVSHPTQPQENRVEVWAAQHCGEEANGGQSKFLVPTEKEDIVKEKDFRRVLCRVLES